MADYSSAIGAGIGGLLGSQDANSGPAGYTNTVQNQDIPDWMKPYALSPMTQGYDLFASLMKKGTSPLLGMSEDELAKTIRGDYLSPESNPYLAAIAKNVSDVTGRSIDSRFSASGRYGSGAYADTVTSAISKALTDLYGSNYNTERGRQYSAAVGAPAYISSSVGAQFAPYADYTQLIPNLRTTNTTEPYFRNKGAGILGGALAGSQLGKMFGGGNPGGGSPDYSYAGTGYDGSYELW